MQLDDIKITLYKKKYVVLSRLPKGIPVAIPCPPWRRNYKIEM